jgi:CheY-like chemotaxis protein
MKATMSKRKRFGEILIEAGVIEEEALHRALQKQKGTRKPLGEVLEEMGIVSQNVIAAALGRQFGFQTVRGIAGKAFSDELLQLIPEAEALKKLIFPLRVADRSLHLAMVNPLDMSTLDSLSFRTGLRIVPCVTTSAEIYQAVQRHYLEKEILEAEEKIFGGGKWSVLVVDDHELVRGAVAAALRREDCDVKEAINGAEGLKLAIQDPPHLIVADILMPRMDGYQMFRSLQSNPATRNVPVIAFSAKSSPEEEAKVLAMGYFDFIAKPINQVRLVARVKRALRLVYEKNGNQKIHF